MPESSPSEMITTLTTRQARLERLRRLSYWLDNAIAIPGTPYRIGLDPILGLIPGGGDTLGLIFSSMIVIEAARLGASRATLGRMVFNVFIETVFGTLPLIGDFFDFAWKSNQRNLRLLDEHFELPRVELPRASRQRNRRFVLLLTILMGLAIVFCIAVSIVVIQGLIHLLARSS